MAQDLKQQKLNLRDRMQLEKALDVKMDHAIHLLDFAQVSHGCQCNAAIGDLCRCAYANAVCEDCAWYRL